MEDADDVRVVIPEHIVTKNTDSRGRVNLGSDYADKRVKVAILDVEGPDNDHEK